jgi:xanthine dehydrogenase YagT iron-sulfur-binding subunit
MTMQKEKQQLTTVSFKVNGKESMVSVEPRETLLDTLRDELNLTGPKKGCNEAVCGACTVLVNGKAICSCTMFAVEAEGSEVTTIEGLALNPKHRSYEGLDPIQRVFIEFDGFQCGFCTAGQIMSAKSFVQELNERRKKERIDTSRIDEVIKEAMSGNLCRCGCYNGIVEAVKSAAAASG